MGGGGWALILGGAIYTGLSAGTVITKETKERNNRVLLEALLFGCIVSFVLRNLCLGTHRRTDLTEGFLRC